MPLLSLFLRLCLLAAVLSGAHLHAQTGKDLRVKVPPPPIPRKATLDRGQNATIPLGVYGPGVEQMEFIIRTPPKHGTLSRVQITGDSTAAVVYTAPAQTNALEDRFTYAVRTADGVSAAVPVVITIAEPAGLPPRLVVPGSLDGEEQRTGEEYTFTIPIKNAGGGYAEGEFTIAPPWKVQNPAKFRLAGGESMEVTVTFSAMKIGAHKADLTYGAAHRVSTTLNAKVVAPLTITPALLDLKAKPGAATRSGQVKLTNQSSLPVTVTIKHGGALLTEQSVTVPALDSHTLAVFAEPGEVGKIEDRLEMKAGEWTHSLPVIAQPLGAIVSCREKSVTFTGATAERTVQSNITLENSGGSPVAVTLTAPAPFRTDPTAIALKPKSTATIAVLCKADTEGLAEGELAITGADVDIRIPLSANIGPREAAKKTPPKTPHAEEPPAPKPVREAKESSTPSAAAELPNIRGKAIEVKATKATIEWKASQKPGLRAQSRILAPSGDTPAIAWKDIKATFAASGTNMQCTVDSLAPQSLHTIRIISNDGVECTVNFVTLPSPPYLIYALRALLLIGAVAGIAIYLRKRRAARA